MARRRGGLRRSLSNYLGWLLTSWLVFLAFALCLRRQPARPAPSAPRRCKLHAIAILFYVSLGLTHVVAWARGQGGEAVDAAGKTWQVGDLRAATVAIMFFTMLFSGLPAALHLAKQDDF